jgi:hypothetical protein
MGGGGGANADTSFTPKASAGVGGVGGMVVEYFYTN